MRRGEPDVRRPIGAGDPVTAADLTPGRVIERWTDPAAGGVRVRLPCHGRQAVTADPRTAAAAVCRRCSQTYQLVLEPAADGGYFAILTVAYVPHLISRQARR